MKTILTIASMLLVLTAHAQTKVKKDTNGDYVAVSRTDTAKNTPTGSNFVDKQGVKHPIYLSARGKLFYYRTSKAGNVYKAYIKVNTD